MDGGMVPLPPTTFQRLVGEVRQSPFALGQDGFFEVAGEQHCGIPAGNMLEAVGDGVVAAVVHDFLEAMRGEWGLGGDGRGQFADACLQGLG